MTSRSYPVEVVGEQTPPFKQITQMVHAWQKLQGGCKQMMFRRWFGISD